MDVNIDVEYYHVTGYRSIVDMPELIIDTSEAGIATFALNRPAELNAWTYPLEASFFAALDSAASDPEVRVVVVTGAGRGFCAGASMRLLGDGDRSERSDRAQRRRLCELAEFPKPVIAAVNGPAGLGFALAMSCDIRFAAADSKLTTSFARLGLVAEHGVAWLLPRLVGGARARDLLLSGRTGTSLGRSSRRRTGLPGQTSSPIRAACLTRGRRQAGVGGPIWALDERAGRAGQKCIRLHATVVTARSDKQLAEPDIKGFGLLPAAGGVRQRPGGVDASR